MTMFLEKVRILKREPDTCGKDIISTGEEVLFYLSK